MKRLILAILVAVALLAGCFPVLLDVDSRGRVLIPRGDGLFLYDSKAGTVQLLARPAAGVPAWARWSPDGAAVLLCTTDEGKQSELLIVNARSRQAKSFGTFSAPTCALWSPDGRAVTVVQRKGDNEHCIVLVNLATGERKNVLDRAMPMHCWASPTTLVAFRIENPQGDSGVALGKLIALDLPSGREKVLAPATCSLLGTLDLDPGGKKVLLTEWVRGSGGFALVTVNVDDGAKTALIPRDVLSAFWSPDGKHIAVTRLAGIQGNAAHIRFSVARRGPQCELVVTDAAGASPVTVVDDVISRTELTGDGRPVFPAWLANDRLLAFQPFAAYGPVGGAMHLVSVKIDGSERTDLQTTINAGVADCLKGARGR